MGTVYPFFSAGILYLRFSQLAYCPQKWLQNSRVEWQCLVEKLGETTGEVDDSDESTTEAED